MAQTAVKLANDKIVETVLRNRDGSTGAVQQAVTALSMRCALKELDSTARVFLALESVARVAEETADGDNRHQLFDFARLWRMRVASFRTATAGATVTALQMMVERYFAVSSAERAVEFAVMANMASVLKKTEKIVGVEREDNKRRAPLKQRITCNSCGKFGHKAAECRSSGSGGGRSSSRQGGRGSGGGGACYTCGLEGHRSAQCPHRAGPRGGTPYAGQQTVNPTVDSQ